MKKEIIIALIIAGAIIAGHKVIASEPAKPSTPQTEENPATNKNPDNNFHPPDNGMCRYVNGVIRCMGLLPMPHVMLKPVETEKTRVDWNIARIVKVKCSSPDASRMIAEDLKSFIAGSKNYNELISRLKYRFEDIFGAAPNYPDNLWYTLAWNLYHVPGTDKLNGIPYMVDLKSFAAGILKPRNPDASYFGKTWLPG